jgi:putative ABC transport system permease protein
MGAPTGWRSDALIGWRNLGRNPKRTAMACLAIAIAQAALIFINSFMNGYDAKIFETLTGPMLGHIQIHAKKYRDDGAIERVIEGASNLENLILKQPDVKSVSARIYAPVLASLKEMGHVAEVTGLNAASENSPGGILEGLSPQQIPGPNEVLVGRGLAEDMGLKAGDTLALMGQAVDGSIASGLYRIKAVINTPIDQINQSGIVMDLKVSQDFLAMGDQVHELVIHAQSQTAIPGVLSSLKVLPALQPYEILSWDQLVPYMVTLLQMIGKMNILILFLVFLTTMAGVANTMLMATFERIHEFGMLLALGCKPFRLLRMVIFESLTLGIVGVGAGTLLGLGATWYFVQHGLDLYSLTKNGAGFGFEGMNFNGSIFFILKPMDVLGGVAAVCVTSLLASIWPARKIGKLEPVEAMRA